MNIMALCVSNEHFEDTLKAGELYTILELCPTGSGVRIINEKGDVVWHGTSTCLRLQPVEEV